MENYKIFWILTQLNRTYHLFFLNVCQKEDTWPIWACMISLVKLYSLHEYEFSIIFVRRSFSNQIENTFKKVFYLFFNIIKCYTFQIPLKGMYNIFHQWNFYDVSGISENMGESHSSWSNMWKSSPCHSVHLLTSRKFLCNAFLFWLDNRSPLC